MWAPVAPACNPSYSGGRDQEDCSLKLAGANSSGRSYLEKKKKIKKIGLVSGSRCSLISNPNTAKNKQRDVGE
jgi:ribosome assembly protein YihI (activator of Der GTPase)